MTNTIIKDFLKSALFKPVFLILLIIVLLLVPASAFASDDDSPSTDSSSATVKADPSDQSGGFELSAPAGQFDSPAVFDQGSAVDFGNISADFSVETPTLETPSSSPSPLDAQLAPAEVIASVDTETADTDTGLNGTSDTGGSDPTGGQDFAALETNLTTADDYPAGEAKTTTLYFQVEEVSMSPLLNPGAIVEIASETYADGDMVVAQKSDGTYIVKMLSGDQLVSLGAGDSYNAADVTILGAAAPSLLTAEDLELNGLTWHTALAQTATQPAGSGTSGSPYLITSLENLYWITASDDDGRPTQAARWAAYYIQVENIDATATSSWDSGKGWTPIGTAPIPFSGTYNGQGNTISDLFINRPAANYQGLFGYTNGATLTNIALVNADVTGNNYVGGLVGYNSGASTISKCYAKGTVTGVDGVGGLVGYNWPSSGKIENSYAICTVNGRDMVGGLVGFSVSGEIKNCYVAGRVNGITKVGGLVGQNNSGSTITYCLWDSEVNNNIHLKGVGYGSGYAPGYNTTQMKELATYKNTITYTPWDIDGVDGSYPVLGWQVNWKNTIWYMGTPPVDDGSGGGSGFGGDFGSYDFDFASALLTQLSTGLTTVTGQSNAVITPGIIAYGSWNDLYQASAAYQVALGYLESNQNDLSPAKRALLEVELAIARAAILAMEARLLAAEGLPYNLAALQSAYAEAVATLNAHQSFLSADQLAAANQLLAAIAGVIAALQ